MNTANNDIFNWDKLLDHIFKYKKVIPIIGQGLYRVEIEGPSGKSRPLLYDYLADQVSEECGVTLRPGEPHMFAKACFAFLENNNYYSSKLSEFLEESLEGVRLVQPNALWKLARIKNFGLFINTTYDNFLAGAVKKVRKIPPEELFYTVGEKNRGRMSLEVFKCLESSKCTIVYQVFGNVSRNENPAFGEKDMLETIIELHKDMLSDKQGNKLFWKLKSSSPLFIGCGFNDWLFRFFIHIIADEPRQALKYKPFPKFVVDNFGSNVPGAAYLREYLDNSEVEVFHSPDGSDFVDRLFNEIETKHPELIVSPSDFPGTAFISFEGKDREAARLLAENLEKDGIGVWLDEKNLEPGEKVDEIIFKDIKNCPAFIPLISENSRQIKTENGQVKYHIEEWLHAYACKESGERNIEIIPVNIDNTKWIYHKFKDLFYITVPGGERTQDYKKLLKRLEAIQRDNQG